MLLPTIHLNGSDPDTLAEGYERAASAVQAAIDAVACVAPNDRDYYPQGEGVGLAARREHIARVDALCAVKADLARLLEHATEAVDARKARRELRSA